LGRHDLSFLSASLKRTLTWLAETALQATLTRFGVTDGT
jgi:hypothetical protein